jgi:effector-binding domain-containing protein
VAYEVRAEWAEARELAALRAETDHGRLGADILRLLDQIWPVLREQGAKTGHNVVVYYPGQRGGFTIAAGVETFGGFTGRGEIQPVSTPAGEVATVAYFGEYSKMAPAYEALEQWCAGNGRRRAEVAWEVYGDPDPDPAKTRTDIYFLLEPTGVAHPPR